MTKALAHFSDLMANARSAGETMRQGLESVRLQIIEVQGEKSRVLAIPCDEATAHARVDDLIANILSIVRHHSLVPTGHDLTRSPAGYHGGFGSREGPSVLLTYFAPQLAFLMKAEASKALKEEPGLTEDERREMLSMIDREILDLEMTEESIIRHAQAAGFTIYRRGAADPRAVLAPDDLLP